MVTTQEKRDYYTVLGVDRSASPEQLKQAYRRLAMQYHPDRNPASNAAERFREIAEAYAVLSDDVKRREYDAAGHAGVSRRWSTEDLFRDFQFGDFFGGRVDDLFGIFGDLLGRASRPAARHPRARDLWYDLDLTLEEAAHGGERVIEVARSEICRPCSGSGAKPGTQPTPCKGCGGTGQKQQAQDSKGVHVVTLTTCAQCSGRGHFILSPCETCGGKGFEFRPHTLKVQLPAGIDDGMIVRLAGQGQPSADGGPPGDLLIHPHLRPHASFQRQGDDLHTSVAISFPQAALGTTVSVQELGGKALRLTVPAGIQSGTALRIAGKGMPRVNAKGKGNLYVTVNVTTPVDPSSSERDLLEKLRQLEAKRGKRS
jgi:molecular chaperone DnaJ